MPTMSNIQPQRIGCGDHITTDTTTAVMGNKKKAYKRRDCGGDTNTPTVMEKKKRPYRRKKGLPHDLILEEILTKLPVPVLLKSVRVSKLWYNSIHTDHKRLTYSHFLESQKHPQVVLSLLNVREGSDRKTGDPIYGCHFFKFAPTSDYCFNNVLRFDKFRNRLGHANVWEMVGYCNGLPCISQAGNYSSCYTVLDPNRRDFICIFHPASVGMYTQEADIICHGFGFDLSANEYKVVSVFRSAEMELNFVVFTLGTKSWRNVTPMSAHGGRPVAKIRAPTGSDRSAIYCATSGGGCLVWKIAATLGGVESSEIMHDDGTAASTNEVEMLLSFSLHDEKFRFIPLPAEHKTDEQQKRLLVDYPHLLEFKGSPCIARTEKISCNGSGYRHRFRDDHLGSGSGCCCCCCKVHMYILKDQVEQDWVRDESFDVCINSTPAWLRFIGKLAPDPCCFCLGGTTTRPRILSFSDQIFLYWLNNWEYLQVYNLRAGKFELVLPRGKEGVVFRKKVKEPRHVLKSSDDGWSNMDYQLHRHEENFLSLETFVPEGVQGVGAAVFRKLDLEREDRPCSVFVFIYRGSGVYYPCFN